MKMKFFMFFCSKRKFSDGSIIWKSGKERITYQDKFGRRVDFSVYFSETNGEKENIVVTSSIDVFEDGLTISSELKNEIIMKCKKYFSERGESTTLV